MCNLTTGMTVTCSLQQGFLRAKFKHACLFTEQDLIPHTLALSTVHQCRRHQLTQQPMMVSLLLYTLTLTYLSLDMSGMAGFMQEKAIRNCNYRNKFCVDTSRNKGAVSKRVVEEKIMKARGKSS